MKILFVIETLGRAGAEQALVNLLPALAERGHTCEVAALWPPYDLAPVLRDAGIVVHQLDIPSRWNLSAVAKLAALCREGEFDILHAHLFFAAIYVALTRQRCPKARRVVTFHNLDYDLYPARTPWLKARKALHARLMKRMDGCTAVSQAVAAHYRKHLRLRRVEVIPNAFQVDRITPDAHLNRSAILGPWGIKDEFTFVTAARLAVQKGHRFLFEALGILKERGLTPKLLVLGDGALRGALEEQVRELKLDDQVSFCGAVPHPTVLKFEQAADAFVLASTHEGFGLVVAEAMLLQRPVLATDIGGVEDIVQNGTSGLLVPPADPRALADGMARLMQDGALRERLGEAGRQRIIETFSTDIVAARWEAFYGGLLEGRR